MARVPYFETIANGEGQPIASGTIDVRHKADNSLATLYAAETGGTTKDNPLDIEAADEGLATFWIDEGLYDITVTSGGSSETYTQWIAKAPVRFTTVAAMVADTRPSLGLVGEDVYADGFRYTIAASGATDHHLTTAGGVKLYVQPILAGAQGGLWSLAAMDVDLTGATNESAAVQTLFDAAAAAGGGQLFHPGGTVVCSVDGRAGVGLLGVGPASVWQRIETEANSPIVRWIDDDAFNVSVMQCAVDLRTDSDAADLSFGAKADYSIGLQFDDMVSYGDPEAKRSNIIVTNNIFYNSNIDTSGNWTNMLLVARGVNDLIVSNNVFYGGQAKLAGGGRGTYRVTVTGNTFHNVAAYAISVVALPVVGEQIELKDITVSNNAIFATRHRAPAIYVGVDDGSGGELRCCNISIANNTIRANAGTNFNSFACILLRAGEPASEQHSLAVIGNVCYVESDESGPYYGLAINASQAAVVNNVVSGHCDLEAIRATGNKAVVSGNCVTGQNRGIKTTGRAAMNNYISADGDFANSARLIFSFGAGESGSFCAVGNVIRNPPIDTDDFFGAIEVNAVDGVWTGGIIANAILGDGNTAHAFDFDTGTADMTAVQVALNYIGADNVRQRIADLQPTLNFGALTEQPFGPNIRQVNFVHGPILPDYTATEIADATHGVNTGPKTRGTVVYERTNSRLMVATGSGATDNWIAADGGVSVTPS